MRQPLLITDPKDLPKGDVALVPTMGALHEGHLSLVREARRHASHVVVSIFVNPTQFAPGEDYEQYPRTLEADVEKLSQVGADVVFAPSARTMYPSKTQVTIDPGPLAEILEGASRPTHFAGVCQIVAKLFNLVRPAVAVFGQKDAQQLAIIRHMVTDLSYPIEIICAPIVREENGLALSSRNTYLNQDERAQAVMLSRALFEGAKSDTPAQQVAITSQILQEAGIEPEYVEVVTTDGFDVLSEESKPVMQDVTLLVAARIGSTRLIDNVTIRRQ